MPFWTTTTGSPPLGQAGEPKIELIKGEIASISLKPGDKLVLMTNEPINPLKAQYLSEAMERWAPGIPCVVLENMRLGVIRSEDET